MAVAIRRNARLAGFRSLHGGEPHPVRDFGEGAPDRGENGVATSVAAIYSSLPAGLTAGRGMLRFGDWLPYSQFPSLGEGDTPTVPLNDFAASLDLRNVWLKQESANPTGSHKDRMSPLCVARALETAAPGVICASTGNAALSLAAYAAAGSLPCWIVATEFPENYRRVIERMGAKIIVAPDFEQRWSIMADLVRTKGWLAVTNYVKPAVGSNPFGVQGYRTIAFELHEAVGPLDAIAMPVARGDLAWGVMDGYRALQSAGILDYSVPRLVLSEPFPRLDAVIAGRARISDDFAGTTAQLSIAGSTATDQSLRAVSETGGTAVVIGDATASAMRDRMARAGYDMELCSAAAAAAVEHVVRNGQLRPGSRVAIINTSGSAREPV
ncbi:MAG: pyridoxal-phosphate dependent enzyme [Parvibaculaceae bacterium]